jgi:hypothetical protein
MTNTSQKYLRNPMTGEIKFFKTRLSSRKYQSFGWQKVSRSEYEEYVRATLQAAILRYLPGSMGRVQ